MSLKYGFQSGPPDSSVLETVCARGGVELLKLLDKLFPSLPNHNYISNNRYLLVKQASNAGQLQMIDYLMEKGGMYSSIDFKGVLHGGFEDITHKYGETRVWDTNEIKAGMCNSNLSLVKYIVNNSIYVNTSNRYHVKDNIIYAKTYALVKGNDQLMEYLVTIVEPMIAMQDTTIIPTTTPQRLLFDRSCWEYVCKVGNIKLFDFMSMGMAITSGMALEGLSYAVESGSMPFIVFYLSKFEKQLKEEVSFNKPNLLFQSCIRLGMTGVFKHLALNYAMVHNPKLFTTEQQHIDRIMNRVAVDGADEILYFLLYEVGVQSFDLEKFIEAVFHYGTVYLLRHITTPTFKHKFARETIVRLEKSILSKNIIDDNTRIYYKYLL